MTRKEILKRLYRDQLNIIHKNTEDYEHEIPTRGCERIVNEAKEIAEELDLMIGEIEDEEAE